MKSPLLVLGLSLLALPAPLAFADTLTGVFVFGTGNWDTIPNGEFEAGSLAEWTGGALTPASFSITSSSPIVGSYSAEVSSDVSFSGDGISLNSTASVPVLAGQSYVLSGFIGRSLGATANMSLDLNDAAFEVQPHTIIGIDATQFVWGTFTPTSDTTVTVRLVLDGNVTAGDTAFLDEVAITPVEQFVPPTVVAVPELPGTAMFAGAMLAGFALWRRR